MDNSNIPNEEEERKQLARKRLRVVLIILNLVLLVEFVYGLINIVYKQIKSSNTCSVTNKLNKKIDDYRFNNIAIRDYIIYGDNLSLYRYDYDYEGKNDYFIKENAQFVLKDLCQNKEFSFDVSSSLDSNIKLTTLTKGNYFIFYKDNDTQSLLTYEIYDKDLDYTLYSLPYKKNNSDINYTRKKITISHVMSNSFPLMLVSVEENKYIEDELDYDFALDFKVNDQTKDIAYQLKNKLEEKGIRVYLTSNSEEYSSSEEIKNLRNIYEKKVKYAIKFQTEDVESITYYRSSKVNGYMPTDTENDDYNFIKQLGGKSLEAGLCLESSNLVSCGLGNKKYENGINSLVVSVPTNLTDNQINTLVNNIFNSYLKS